MQQRRLAAIMFTDIAGYTALMGSDEDRAFEVLRKNRELHRRLIKKYRGELIKEMGDGMLISFQLTSDAVRCAQSIQFNAIKDGIPLKIGIHEGEMVFEGADVLGDGVNIASRLQEGAPKGCINISDAVYKDIKNNKGISVELVEEKTFKNIDEPIKVYKVEPEDLGAVEIKLTDNYKVKEILEKFGYIIVGIVIVLIATTIIWHKLSNPISPISEKSIAVLPFSNMSNLTENQYFCDGIMEDILTHLSFISELKVTSRTSSIKYRNSDLTVPEIGRQLGVSYILEGSVRRDSIGILVTVQLIDSRDDVHLWSGRYEKELSMNNIWDMQNEIAEHVANNLKITISPPVLKAGIHKPTENYFAYDLYMKGREFYHRYYSEDNDMAIRLFHKAVSMDTTFALAYAGLADAYAQKVLRYSAGNPMLDSAEYYGKLSILYDEELPEGYKALGLIERTKNNMDLAISYTEKAVSINSNFTDAITNLGFFWVTVENFSKGLPYLEQAMKLNPRDTEPLNYLGVLYYFKGDYSKANTFYTKSLQLEPDNRFANYSYLQCLIAQREFEESESYSDVVLAHTQDSILWHWYRGALSYINSDYEKALYHFEKNLNNLHVAACYLAIGETDRAVIALNKLKAKDEQYWSHRPGTWTDCWIAYELAVIGILLDDPEYACKWLDISLEEGRVYMYRAVMNAPIIIKHRLPTCINEILNNYFESLNK